jgi:L-ectoine synthase
MIVVNVDDFNGTERAASGPGWQSTRLLVKDDGLGYSLHDTHVAPGAALELEYKHHVETNYCVGGAGEVVDLTTGITHPLRIGSIYTLDKNERHIVRAFEDGLHLVCVFTPALKGSETHSEDGSYEAS